MFEIQPRVVYVVWESGGSPRRRNIYKEYKLGRSPMKLNRYYEDDIPDNDENKKHQIVALLEMLKHVPVCQLYVPDCEGDDVIAYLVTGAFNGDEKVIVSSDKDMYQLLDASTRVYNLHRKVFVTADDVFKEFRIRSQNFALAKALCGDPSDNIPGIKGLGFKTLVKRLPFVGLEQDILLNEVKDYCTAHEEESTIYKRIVECWTDVERNWHLVYLNANSLSASQAQKVKHAIDTFKPCADKIGMMRELIKEGVNDFDVQRFFYSFNGIDGLGYRTDGDNE
jgi:5'-3' exonuclease